MTRVLIVDDQDDNLYYLRALLEGDGCTVESARDGAEALIKARQVPPGLIISDLLMPVMDGFTLLRHWKADAGLRHVPFVVYTATYTQPEDEKLAVSLGADAFILKPAEPEDLLRQIREVQARGVPAVPAPASSGDGDEPALLRMYNEALIRKLEEKTLQLDGTNRELHGLNRALTMLSAGSQTLITAVCESELLNDICAIAVETGGYRMAWIGFAQHDEARSVMPAAHAGVEDGYLSEVTITWNGDDPRGRGPAGTAIREGHAIVFEDLSRVDAFGPWRSAAVQRGYRANVCLPLRDATHTFGVMALFSAEVHQPTSEELRLLQRMADNLAFGIGALRARIETDRLDAQVREQASLLDIAREAILVKDLDGRILYWNKGAERTYGWTAAEAFGQKSGELFHVDAGASRNALAAVLARDEWHGEEVRHAKDGRPIVVEAGWTLVRGEQGQPRSILSIHADVTERKQAAEMLRAAEERMRYALLNANIGIWDLDYATGDLRVSAILESQFGVQPGTFGGTLEALVEAVHPLDRATVRATMTETARSGSEFSVEYRVIRPDGTTAWLHGRGRVQLGDRGEPVRGIGISMDVTEHRALEAQFQQAQKMEAVGRLAGGVAHDYNNVLAVILGYCELLLEDIGQDDPHRADLMEIHKAGTRAAGLTRQLLAFSRKEIIEPTLLDLNAIVADIRGMLGPLIGEDVTLVVGLGPGPTPVKADRGQVEQVIMNLAVNARDAMPMGGTLTIKTANVELDRPYAVAHPDCKAGPYVALTVTDTGTGMTPEVRAKLFEPFFTTKDIGKGTGLGLATVFGIVTRSGGRIDVDTEPGTGTAFTVYFPRVDATPIAVAAPVPVARPPAASATILVVEDEAGLRELAKRLLQRLGYTILVAGDADQARRVFDEHPGINLLLVDVVMPGTSGPDLARELMAQRPALKVMYMSGYTQDAIARHGVLLPGIAFVHKPFTVQILGRKVREVLER